MLSAGDIGEGFARARIAAALGACAANAVHKGLWQEEQADALGINLDTFKGYYYGRSTPGSMDEFCRIVAHFGPRFLTAYFAPLGLACIRSIDAETMGRADLARSLREAPNIMRSLAGVIENAIAVPKEGKVK